MHSFRRNCEMLRKFGDCFWSANVVACLGERVLKEMERAANTLAKDTSPPPPSSEETPSSVLSASSQPISVPRQPESTVPVANPTMINSVPSVEQPVDFSIIDAISGQDVFGHIDPNFDLNAVEDALEANLDIALPFNWGDWGQYAT